MRLRERLKSREEKDVRRAMLAMSVAAYALNVHVDDMFGDTRGRTPATHARQLAMYLAHVAFEMSLSRIAVAFGRDRSTVAHACHRMEDCRDDAACDAWMESLESMVRAAPALDTNDALQVASGLAPAASAS